MVSKVVKDVYSQFNDCLQNQAKYANEGIRVSMENDSNVLVWTVLFGNFPNDSLLFHDILKWKQKGRDDFVKLEVEFPSTYPTDPPFIRVVSPRFQFHTGHVTVGGSLCIESLVNTGTPTGWQSTTSIWGVLVQCKQLMVEGGGRIDMLDGEYAYTKREAQAAFTRVAGQHGWITRAEVASAGLYTPSFPAACNPWWDQDQVSTLVTVPLPGLDPMDHGIQSMRYKEAVAIAKIFVDRWTNRAPKPVVVAITRVQNLRVFDKFYTKLMELSYIARVNEKWMFHGLRTPESAKAIIEHGFDTRVSEKGFLGAGIYCAENSDLAHTFTTQDGAGFRYCLYGRFMLGESENVQLNVLDKMYWPTYRRGGTYSFFHQGEQREITRNYDSQSTNMYPEWPFSVLFSNEQAYPDYLITYRADSAY